jgi:hypothetical protein
VALVLDPAAELETVAPRERRVVDQPVRPPALSLHNPL